MTSLESKKGRAGVGLGVEEGPSGSGSKNGNRAAESMERRRLGGKGGESIRDGPHLSSNPTFKYDEVSLVPFDRSLREITDTVRSLKRRGDMYKDQLRTCMGKLKSEEHKTKKIEEAKSNAAQRWKVAKAQLKKTRNKSNGLHSKLKDSKNRIRYLEKLLAFEERSGFSTLVSEMQLE